MDAPTQQGASSPLVNKKQPKTSPILRLPCNANEQVSGKAKQPTGLSLG
jgi:hypothetical protein